MNISKVLNIAVGCVMASGLEMKEKREVIDSLRSLEEKLNGYKNSLENISNILDGQNVTPLVESLAYELVHSGIYEKEDKD
jgi:hypothetical protein